MHKLLIATLALGLMAVSPTLAEQKPDGAAAATAEPTHEMCKSMMGRKMDGKAMHDHSAEKGAARPPLTKPLSKAEMDRMHAKCAARMAAESEPAKK